MRHIILLSCSAAIWPLLGLAHETPCENTILEVVELSTADQSALIAAPPKFLDRMRRPEVREAIIRGEIDSTKVQRLTTKFVNQNQDPLEYLTTHQGWVYYPNAALPNGDSLQLRVLCVSQGEEVAWNHCQDASKVSK